MTEVNAAAVTHKRNSCEEWIGVRPFLSSEQRRWNGLLVEKYDVPRFDAPEGCYANTVIILQLTSTACVVEHKVHGQLRRENFRQGEVGIFPPNFSHVGRAEAPDELLAIHLEKSLLVNSARESVNPERVNFDPRFDVHDQQVERIGLTLMTELEQGNPTDRIFGESLGNALAAHLLKRYSTLGATVRDNQGSLTKPKLRRTLEYIDAHLADDLTLAGVAAAAHISESHFARSFKQATGIAPHKYITVRRVERAKQLLAETDLPIVEVAFSLGFSSHSHLTAVFHRLTGVTPKTFREG